MTDPRLHDLFHRALALPVEERARFVEEQTEGDPGLGDELRSLLRHAEADPDFLERVGEEVVSAQVAELIVEAEHARLAAALGDRYRVRERVGQGGMATVYRADDLRHERSVALKVLDPQVAASLGPERFLAEIRTTAKLQHPHILPLFDSGEAEGLLYYVMPYVEGESLRERLDRETQLPVDEAVEIALTLADALEYAHRHGVVHRDLKPGNVMLDEGRPYLVDFGIALAIERAETGGRLTETGRSIGTPLYMSPEQASGEGEVSPASDLFALGCLLYEMLVGEPPHTGPSRQAILSRILTDEVRPLTEHRRTVPAHVDAAVRKALEKLPADRFRDAGAFAEALMDSQFRYEVSPVAPRAVAASGTSRSLRPWMLAASVVVLGVVAWLGFGRPTAEASPPSVAVMPLEDLSGSDELAYFGESIAEEITNALTKIPELQVAGRYSAALLRGRSVGEVARQLGVRSVLIGSFLREGDSVRVNAQLVDGDGGFNLWSGQYDQTMESVIAIQEEIARSVARELRVTLVGGERLVSAETDSPEAYDLYLRGRSEWNARGEGISGSIDYFQRAIDLDPGFALAWAGLSDAYVLLYEYNAMAPEEALPLARRAAEEALSLDPDLAEAHTSLAEVLAGERRWEESVERFRRALELNPGYLTAHHWYGWLLSHLARHDEAIEYLRRAKEIDPLSGVVRIDLAAAYYHARRFTEAVAEAEACHAAQICGAWGRTYGRSLVALGRHEEALEYARGQARPVDRVLALAALGREVDAREILEEYREPDSAREDPLDFPITQLYLAEMYTALGEYDAALDAVERAEALGLSTGPVLIREWPAFDPIREHPRYQAVLERMGYPD